MLYSKCRNIMRLLSKIFAIAGVAVTFTLFCYDLNILQMFTTFVSSFVLIFCGIVLEMMSYSS